jgi:hypothetical protein
MLIGTGMVAAAVDQGLQTPKPFFATSAIETFSRSSWELSKSMMEYVRLATLQTLHF